jgi:hypothetical protein
VNGASQATLPERSSTPNRRRPKKWQTELMLKVAWWKRKIRASRRRALGVARGLYLVELPAQLLDPLPVGGLGRVVQQLAGVADARGDGEALLGAAGAGEPPATRSAAASSTSGFSNSVAR